jgi:hypothetical protein
MYYISLDSRRVILITEERPEIGQYIVCADIWQAMSKAADLLLML